MTKLSILQQVEKKAYNEGWSQASQVCYDDAYARGVESAYDDAPGRFRWFISGMAFIGILWWLV